MTLSLPRLKLIAVILLATAMLATTGLAHPSEDDPRIEAWRADWPDYVDMYLETRDMSKPTPFGGNVPYSKLIRFPGKTALWAGFAFGLDFNEERGHYFSQIDQMESGRNDRTFLNANGLVNFRGQPSACMNCHSGWAPMLAEQMGWETFNGTPYWTTIEQLRKEHGHGSSGAELGSACTDCHNPDDMSLRVNRRAYIDIMVERGYEADTKSGLKGTPKEMRDHVCAQCHVEYYFKGENNVLKYPWNQWPKGQPFRIEMMEDYYEIERNLPDGFQADWIHAVTKAPMLKMQHPEVEVASSGKHAKIIGCADCHMPRIQRNGKTVTDHTLNSPLNKLESCLNCHNGFSEEQLYQWVYDIQVRNVVALLRAEKAILALIEDIAMVRRELGTRDPFAQIADDGDREAAITAELTEVLDSHRRSSMRWDFIGASNSTGVHSPAEALRVLEQAVVLARDGQVLLKGVAARHGVELVPTTEPTLPAAPSVLDPGNIVGSLPPAITREADRATSDRLLQ
jgi:nitrite reductase (cytochrome c-552)